MMVVTTPALAARLEELITEVVVAIPLTVEVSVLTREVSPLPLTKFAVVVAVLPLTMDVSTNELVEVAIVNV